MNKITELYINTNLYSDSNLLELVTDYSGEAIATQDISGKFTYVSQAMLQTFGYDRKEVLGQSWQLFFEPKEARKIDLLCLPALDAKAHWQGALEARKKNGDRFSIDVSFSCITDNAKNRLGTFWRIVDTATFFAIQSELIRQKKRYEMVFDYSPILIAHINKNYCYRIANKAYCEWVGISKNKIIGASLKDVLDPVSFSFAKTNIDCALQGKTVSFEVKVPHVSGLSRWVNATYIPDRDINGEVSGFCAFIIDIEEQKQEEFKRQTLMQAIDRGIEGFGLHDRDGVFLYANSALANMYGYSVQELLGKSWRQLYDTEQAEKIVTKCLPYLFEYGNWRGELIGLKKDKSRFDVEVSLTLTKNEADEIATLFCACRDISEQNRSRKEVNFLAFHDPLTGLPNRQQFKEQLTKVLKYASQFKTTFAILFIDLDYFKHVNDTLGHSIGDQLLLQVATRLKTVFRLEDTVARLSGDEFTILLNEVSEKRSVEIAINKLLGAFNTPFHIGDREIFQTISIGVSLYPKDGKDIESLMKNADAAMYQVKEEGRKNFCFYTPDLTDSAYENMLYRGRLQSALERNEFELHYQPIISLQQKRVCGLEALIRWRHSNGELVYPDKFIHHAEQSNLIMPIGLWVIETVCIQTQTWKTHGIEIDQVAVNVSGNQLQPGFSKDVANILKRTGTIAQNLAFEVTETFFIKGLSQSIVELDDLRKLGISLAIDDFGVGYSSLSQLKQLPTQCLKIDRSFVGDIVDKPDDLAIIEAIIALGKTLSLQIIAEGVETAKQHKLLAELGCQKTQGYFYAKPQPPSEIANVCQAINKKLDAM